MDFLKAGLMVLATLLIAVSTNPASAERYTCGDFVNDKELLFAGNEKGGRLSKFFYISQGFIDGVFYTNQHYSEENELEENAKFHARVMQACTLAPDKDPSHVALSVSEQTTGKDLSSIVAGVQENPRKWTPQQAAGVIAFMDWGSVHCGEIANPLYSLFLTPFRNGANPELLERTADRIHTGIAEMEGGEVKACEAYLMINKGPQLFRK